MLSKLSAHLHAMHASWVLLSVPQNVALSVTKPVRLTARLEASCKDERTHLKARMRS
jgi:hypothetical protein